MESGHVEQSGALTFVHLKKSMAKEVLGNAVDTTDDWVLKLK